MTLLVGCPKQGDEAKAEGAATGIRIDAERFRVELTDDDHAKGGTAPLVTIVVYSDYGCPPCARLWQELEHLLEDYGDDLRVVVRSFTVPGHGRGGASRRGGAGRRGAGQVLGDARAPVRAGRRLRSADVARPRRGARARRAALPRRPRHRHADRPSHPRPSQRDHAGGRRTAVDVHQRAVPRGLRRRGHAARHPRRRDQARARLLDDGVPRAELYATMMRTAATKRVGEPEAAAALRAERDQAQAQAQAAKSTTIIEPRGDARYRIEPGASGLRGEADAPVVIVAFVDFECPFCRKAWKEELAALLERHRSDVAYSVRQLPLPIHTAARGAAKAALAAGQQGKFWEFHDRLLAHEGAVGRSSFIAWAKELGLDEAAFLAALDDPATEAVVAADEKLAVAVGVNGTPGYFVNGRYLGGFVPGTLSGVVDEELARATSLAATTPKSKRFATDMAEAIPESEFPNR
ncbi:MAG: thioredoxin domain-containing protein [Deltaproteobacteria bacterium]|nr:thioredoxin domain-containing protein [Deltaproteobacteria bacterium]